MTKRNGKGGLALVETPAPAPAPLPSLPVTVLVVLAYGGVEPETFECVVRDMGRWPELRVGQRAQDALIDRMRSRIASDFLLQQAGDVLIMVDHDIAWNPGDLEALAAACAETKGVVAGLYPKRGYGQEPPVTYLPGYKGQVVLGEDALVPVAHIGTGFMAIHREVLVKLTHELPFTVGNFWPFFLPAIAEAPGNRMQELSEDYAFCARVLNAGMQVHMHCKPRLLHYGHYAYRLEDAYYPPVPDIPNLTINVNKSKGDRLAVELLAQHVAEFADVAPDRLGQLMVQARRELATLWLKHTPKTPEEETEFYRREDVGWCYIGDLADWHMRGVADGILDEIAEHVGEVKGKHVLDYGAGIGTVALQLALEGADVTAYEPNAKLRDFQEYRADHLEALETGDRYKAVGEPPGGRCHLVICWHVLEHVPDPEATAREVAQYLTPDGVLVTQSDFHVDAEHPMHHTREDNGEGIWQALGLVKVGPNTWKHG